jgi:hypothetical protein
VRRRSGRSTWMRRAHCSTCTSPGEGLGSCHGLRIYGLACEGFWWHARACTLARETPGVAPPSMCGVRLTTQRSGHSRPQDAIDYPLPCATCSVGNGHELAPKSHAGFISRALPCMTVVSDALCLLLSLELRVSSNASRVSVVLVLCRVRTSRLCHHCGCFVWIRARHMTLAVPLPPRCHHIQLGCEHAYDWGHHHDPWR